MKVRISKSANSAFPYDEIREHNPDRPVMPNNEVGPDGKTDFQRLFGSLDTRLKDILNNAVPLAVSPIAQFSESRRGKRSKKGSARSRLLKALMPQLGDELTTAFAKGDGEGIKRLMNEIGQELAQASKRGKK